MNLPDKDDVLDALVFIGVIGLMVGVSVAIGVHVSRHYFLHAGCP